MLDKLDPDQKMKRREWETHRRALETRLPALQRAAHDAWLATIIIFEGWDRAGRGAAINVLTQLLDPRGFKVWPVGGHSQEGHYPWLRRFWLKLPRRGDLAIFDHGWYARIRDDRQAAQSPEVGWSQAVRDIVDLERTLADDGAVIVKLWLHIGQKTWERLHEPQQGAPSSGYTRAATGNADLDYETALQFADEMLRQTSFEWAPWTIVEAEQPRYAGWRVSNVVADALERGLRGRGVTIPAPDASTAGVEADAVSATLPDDAAAVLVAAER